MIYRGSLLYDKELKSYFVIKRASILKNKIVLIVENQFSERKEIIVNEIDLIFDNKKKYWIIN